MIEQTKGEMELSAYKFKQYLGSVSREIQNRRLKDEEETFPKSNQGNSDGAGLHEGLGVTEHD